MTATDDRLFISNADAELFSDYFDVADELDGGLGLAELHPAAVKRAGQAAERFCLPWAPYLPAAEDFALDHHHALNAAHGRITAEHKQRSRP